jgi:hypothetical protein
MAVKKKTNSRPAKRPDDKRLAANRPAERQRKVEDKSRWQQLIDGDITVEDLDLDELARGHVKDKTGNFRGRPPKTVPAELFRSFKVEFQKRAQSKIEGYTELALNALVDVASNKRQAGMARVNAANALLERSLGKVTDKVQQEVIVKKWEENFGDLLVDVDDPEDEVARKRKEKGA